MKFDTHTHITLTQEEVKQVIIDNLKAQGYTVSLQDVEFIISRDSTYEPPSLRCCSIIARKRG